MSGNLSTRLSMGVNWQEAHIILESLTDRKRSLQQLPTYGISAHPDIRTIEGMLSKFRKAMRRKVDEQGHV